MFRRLWSDRGGNYALAFALLGSSLVAAAGGTLDMIRYLESRSRLHDVVDSAALLVATKFKNGETTNQSATALATDTLSKTWSDPNAVITSVTATSAATNVTVTASLGLETYFLKIAGIQTLTATATAEAAWSNTSLEVVLVLDTTGSMADADKMTTMKSAATSMVDTLYAKAGAGFTIKFAVVPFSHFVNVGPSNAAASWIDQGGASRSSYYDTYFSSHIDRLATHTALGKSWKGCVETRPSPYDVDDTAPSSANPNSLFVPAFHPDEPDFGIYYGNSYLGDKVAFGSDWTKMTNAAKYTSPVNKDYSNSILYSNYAAPKGPEFLCASAPLTRLTTASATVKTAIAALAPAGSTNIPEGLAWGFRTLSPKGPFADGRSYADVDNRKVLVLLTDGTNAINTFPTEMGGAYSSWGFPASQRLGAGSGVDQRDGLDAKTRTVCAKIKAAGIQVYTIGLMITDVAGQQLLSECSSGAGHHYDSPSAIQLQSVFDEIAKRISKLRISA